MTLTEDLVERARLRQQLPPPKIRRAIRELHGISQTELAEVLQVSRQTLIRWEQGTRAPRRDAAERYARALIALQDGGAR